MLIRRAEIAGTVTADLRLAGGKIVAIEAGLSLLRDEPVLDASGGALLPGLHDHHLHLFAMAAAQRSLRCGPPIVRDADALRRAVARARPERSWIRGTGYHESVAGALTRTELDAWRPACPIRIQHRSGALWILNSAALSRIGLGAAALPEPWERGVDRDRGGRPTGRLFRLDGWLRGQLQETDFPPLAPIGRQLSRFGVTGVTDATPGNGATELARFVAAVKGKELCQHLVVMGDPTLPLPEGAGVERGAVKLMLTESALPALDDLEEAIRTAHSASRPVAIHCVTRTELVLAVTALKAAGCRPGDRIEHAAVAPPELVSLLAALPVTVVTQPGFLRERGDDYARQVDPADRPWLYRGRGFLEASVPLGGGTDAPFGDPDPWLAMQAAVERRSASGLQLGRGEGLTPERALALFTSPARAPGAAPRRVAVGAAADLCLLDRPWASAREGLSSAAVAATFRKGRLVWDRSGNLGEKQRPRREALEPRSALKI